LDAPQFIVLFGKARNMKLGIVVVGSHVVSQALIPILLEI
jgi:hypothetical protein